MISIKKPVSGNNFVNRLNLLKNLNSAYQIDNVALIGPRRIGKSSLAKQFLEKLPDKGTIKLIFDVQENIGPPGKLAIRLLRSFMLAYCESINSENAYSLIDVEIDPSVLLTTASDINSKTLLSLSRFLMSYYPPVPENEREVFGRILQFIDDFSREMNLRTAVVLDEFQNIVDLNKYKGFENGNLFGFLRGIISEQNHVWYLFTGSAVRIMFDIFGDKDAPFLGRVRLFNVSRFNMDDTIQLVYKCIDKPISSDAINFLFALTKGHPFYVVVILGAADGISDNSFLISRDHIENAFIDELAHGALDIHCRYLFESSLEKSGTLLKETLRVLSNTPHTITELAKKIGRNPGSITDTIKKLTYLDLIEKSQKRYQIIDSILACWIRNVYGYEDIQFEAMRNRINENYKEYFAKLSTEIGFFFESYMREMLGRFDGQPYKDIRLPKFDVVQGVNAFDQEGDVFGRPSNIEIDALCRGKENWICEFKYRKKSVATADIELLMKKKVFCEKKMNIKIHKMLFIAKSGFSEYAIQSDIWCMTIHELNKLLSMLNMKKVNKINFDNINKA